MKRLLMAGVALSALSPAIPASANNTIVCPEHTTCIVPDNQPPPPPVAPVVVPVVPGYAAPTPVEPAPGYTLGMVCRRVWGSPWYVTVAGVFDANNQAYRMAVLWHIPEGDFDRKNQYAVTGVGGTNEYAWWRGYQLKDPIHTTEGRANFHNGYMSYSEYHYTNGVLDAPTRQDPNPQVVRACSYGAPPIAYQ